MRALAYALAVCFAIFTGLSAALLYAQAHYDYCFLTALAVGGLVAACNFQD